MWFGDAAATFVNIGPLIEEQQAVAARAGADFKALPPVRRPRIPKCFTAPVRNNGSMIMGNSNSTFAYDASKRIIVFNMTSPNPVAPNLDPPLVSQSLVYQATHTWMLQGGSEEGVCRQFVANGFHDMFAWAGNPLLSAYGGQEEIRGRPCTRWRLRFSRPNQGISLCADGDIPVQLEFQFQRRGKTAWMALEFGPITAGDSVDRAVFEKPPQCETLAPACKAAERTVDLEAYVFHPGMSVGDYDLAGQDVADLLGDAAFICIDRTQSNTSSWVDHNYTRISRYVVQVSPAYGQYALCNGYADTSPPGPVCFGGDEHLVGREAPSGTGDGSLRCAAESPVGWWYSLPKKGQCPHGKSPDGECSWSVTKRLKTVEQACLLEQHRYVSRCEADIAEGKGFHRSAAALKAAFDSEDLEQGGCPDIGGPAVRVGAVDLPTTVLLV